MLKNYLKTAWRNLLRSKAFSTINIAGLAIGMASAILILLWVQNELSYDKFHIKKDRIYQVWNRATYDGSLQCESTTPKPLGPALKKDYPEIEDAVRVNWNNLFLFSVDDKRLNAGGTIVDPGFLTMFSFPLIEGNAKTALQNISSIVITEKLAKKLFGNENAMGRVVKLDNQDNFTVTGVLKDLPDNTQFSFEYLVPWEYIRKRGWDNDNWGNNSTTSYVLLKTNTPVAGIESKIKNIIKKHSNGNDGAEVFLHPLSKLRLYSKFENGVNTGGEIEGVRLFGLLAIFILLIACINFMNLSTARSEKRSKEVGIRKVIGARRSSLIGQFLGESVLISLIAGILALGIVQLSVPAFNDLTQKQLAVKYGNAWFWLAIIAFMIFTGLVAGSYPAFFLSSFRSISVLKGTFKKAHALITPRKVLVVLQFTIAIFLIIATIIVQQQIRYSHERDKGYSNNNLICTFLNGDISKNYTLIKNELLSTGAAVSVSKSSSPLTSGWSDGTGFKWAGKDPNSKIVFDRFCTDDNLIKTAGFALVEGRDMNLAIYPTDSTAVLLNESAVKIMGFKDPIGQIVQDNGIDWHIIGVIKDFILHSPYQEMKPIVIEGAKGWFNVMHIRMNNTMTVSSNMAAIEKIFKKHNPLYPFVSAFTDQEYEKKFQSEKRASVLAALFAGLTIFISCLGLFGLATYMAENRIKEIGVRKVLGASVIHVTALLSKDFLKLVIISLVIASPIAWYAMSSWLLNFSYRTDISWWTFVMAGGLAIVIALLTVSFQAIKAAIANPVKSLRTE